MEKELEYERPELEEIMLEIEGSFLSTTTGETIPGGDDGEGGDFD